MFYSGNREMIRDTYEMFRMERCVLKTLLENLNGTSIKAYRKPIHLE